MVFWGLMMPLIVHCGICRRTKFEGELLARDFAAKNGLALSVVRLTAIYGPCDMRLFKLFKLAVKSTPVIGTGNIFYHMVNIDDLVQGFILAGEVEAARYLSSTATKI